MKPARKTAMKPAPLRLLPRILPCIALSLALLPAAQASEPTALDEMQGVGDEMGYRLFGETRKNKPILLQNSRPHRVQVFDATKGVYVTIPPYSDRDFPCDGKARLLHVRFSDAFGEKAPFRVSIGCGREIQFIAPAQLARPVPVPVVPPAESPNTTPERADDFNDPAIEIAPLVTPESPAP